MKRQFPKQIGIGGKMDGWLDTTSIMDSGLGTETACRDTVFVDAVDSSSLSHLEFSACVCALVSSMLFLGTRAPGSLQLQPSVVRCRFLSEDCKSLFGKLSQSLSPSVGAPVSHPFAHPCQTSWLVFLPKLQLQWCGDVGM